MGCLYVKVGACLLKYNYCDCIGCNKKFAKFQKLVAKEYTFGLQKPSLDKGRGIVTVIGEGDFKIDATTESILKKLLQRATGKIDVKAELIPKKESGEENQPQQRQEQEQEQQQQQQEQKKQHQPQQQQKKQQQQQEQEQKKQQQEEQQKKQQQQQQQQQQHPQYPMGHLGAHYGQYPYPMNQHHPRAQYGQMEQGDQPAMDNNQAALHDMFSPENSNSCTVM